MRFTPIPTAIVRAYQAGGPDANGQPPEHAISDGDGNPCRHCLKMIPAGAGMRILAHRPFPTPQPFAELGPIFLCADGCTAGGGSDMPEIMTSPTYIIRGYCVNNRIVAGTGAVVPTDQIKAQAKARFGDERVDYVHVRSSSNNCFYLRINRA